MGRAYYTLLDRTGYTLYELEWCVPAVAVSLMLMFAQENKIQELQVGAMKGLFG